MPEYRRSLKKYNSMKLKKILLAGILAFYSFVSITLTSCDGDDDNSPTVENNANNNFRVKANTFVEELNKDADFDVELVKDLALETNFIVIYDPLTDSYDAFNIDNYDPDNSQVQTAADYYYANSARSFFDLDIVSGNGVGDSGSVFQDRSSQIQF